MSRPIDVVIVAYGAPAAVDRCLMALGGHVSVTVVDNSSLAELGDVSARHGAEYIDAGANLGFAAGVNLALRSFRDGEPRDLLLINPDARLQPEGLERLARFLHEPAHAHVACVAPRLVDELGSEQRVAWPFPSPLRMWMEAVGAGRLGTREDFVIGAVLLLRWEALGEVGAFDERFFLYGEETDWQRRAVRLGWRSALCDDVVAVHEGAGSSGDPAVREVLFHAAQETYIRKWHGVPGWWVYRSAACMGAVVRAIVLTGQRRRDAARRTKDELVGERVRGRGPHQA